jgi:MoaA/NifB/PqqE/SkfB family radical SAM enzyme
MRGLLPVFEPDLDWIQVSITTQCNAQCLYCPRSFYRDSWHSRHIDPKLFTQVITGLKNVDLIYLQGWGEPFLHPNFWDMVTQVKQQGFLAGCTSNATVLDDDTLKRTVDKGLDVLALSLAGRGEDNDRIRAGTSFRQVVGAIEKLQRIKAQRRSANPRLHLAYMLLRQGLNDVEQLPDFFLDLGLDHVVLSSLTLPLSRDLEKQAELADSPEEYRDFQAKMSAIFAEPSLQDKVFFHFYNPFQIPGHCAENVQRALCLSTEGVVTPCVFTQIPVRQPVTYWYGGREYTLQQADFGHVQEESLKHIWNRREYKTFRKKLNLEMCSRCAKTKIDSTLQEIL